MVYLMTDFDLVKMFTWPLPILITFHRGRCRLETVMSWVPYKTGNVRIT